MEKVPKFFLNEQMVSSIWNALVSETASNMDQMFPFLKEYWVAYICVHHVPPFFNTVVYYTAVKYGEQQSMKKWRSF